MAPCFRQIYSVVRSTALCALTLLVLACASDDVPVGELTLTDGYLIDGALSRNGKYALVATVDNGAHLWDLTQSQSLFEWNHPGGGKTEFVSVAISPDGTFAATATAFQIGIWHIASGETVQLFPVDGFISDIALSNGAERVLVGLEDHTARVYEGATGRMVRSFPHGDRVMSVAFSDDGRIALSGSLDHFAYAWDVNNAKLISKLEHRKRVSKVVLSPDGAHALSSSPQQRTLIWDVQSGETTHELALGDWWVQQTQRAWLTVSGARFLDQNRIVMGSPPRNLRLWQLDNETVIQDWHMPHKRTKRRAKANIIFDVTEQDGHLLTVSSDGVARKWVIGPQQKMH